MSLKEYIDPFTGEPYRARTNHRLSRWSSLIHNAEFTVDLSPVPNAHNPFFSGFESCQIQGFQECCITWKYASLTVELTVGRIQTFDCICRVNNPFVTIHRPYISFYRLHKT